MSQTALVLFDDAVARDWLPFTLTRPAGELLFGTLTLRGRAERTLGLACAGHIAAPHLAAYDEPWAPPVLQPSAVGTGKGAIFLSSRFALERASIPHHAALLTVSGRVAGVRLLPGGAVPETRFFDRPDDFAPDLPRHEIQGRWLDSPWHLMTGNAERVGADLATASPSDLPPHVHNLGGGVVSLGVDVRIAPGVVLDTREGPVRLEDGVTIAPFTVIAGPAWVGPGTAILGGRFEHVSIGPVCKVHGELEASVLLGYSNKAHDGFIGHALLGMWVNLGALTTNSDLKNNYGTVRVWTPAGEVDTGLRKVGCFLGDHVKTAIGTMLNTGTVVGAGSNVFGGMPPKRMPPFSWGDPAAAYDVDRFLDTAATVMARRDVALSDGQRALLRAAWRVARG